MAEKKVGSFARPDGSAKRGSPASQPKRVSGDRLEAYARASNASDATIRAYEETRNALAAIPARQVYESFVLEPGGDLSGASLIVGVGIGLAGEASELSGPPGEGCVHLYTTEPVSTEVAVSNAYATLGVQALQDGGSGTAVRAVYTGPIDAYSHRNKYRPAPGGVSVGHFKVTAGTLGCYCVGLEAPRNERLMILSNNHVLADVNAATIGDDILQPGAADRGTLPADLIGILENYVVIDFAGPNTVDCATAWVDPASVDRRFLYTNQATPAFFNVSSGIVSPVAGLRVGKSGRTTALTSGYISAIGATINVNMGAAGVAQFVDQFAVRGATGSFSAGGDSGSLIWTWDQARHPVGLLFAGGGGTTFANPIAAVLAALSVQLLV